MPLQERNLLYVTFPKLKHINYITQLLGCSLETATLLAQKKLYTYQEIKDFFCSSVDDLLDPFTLLDMEKAVVRIMEAVKKKEKIGLFGDYDVDGITSVFLLYEQLSLILDEPPWYYFPCRYTEGYGLSNRAIQEAKKKGITLLITLDCGITSIKEIQKAHDLGIEVIVCDHHKPTTCLPVAYAILNPRQPIDSYPNKNLSGCGVACKLSQALVDRKLFSKRLWEESLVLVSLSIAADIVPIVGENRILAKIGLKKMVRSYNTGLQFLFKRYKLEKEITVSDLVFKIAPLINASGRISHASKSFQLLLAKTEQEAETATLILEEENKIRRLKEQEIFTQIKEQIVTEQPESGYIFFNSNWSKGVLGIVASRCVEQLHCPVIVLTEENGYWVGSGRSPQVFDIYAIISCCIQYVFTFGGHSHAIGITIEKKNLQLFYKAFLSALSKQNVVNKTSKLLINMKIHFSRLTEKFLNTIERFRPFGPKNPRPIFVTSPVKLISYQTLKRKHTKLLIQEKDDTKYWKAIAFNAVIPDNFLSFDFFQLAYTPYFNHFKGKRNIELLVRDFKPISKKIA